VTFLLKAGLLTGHLLVAAVWLGAMTYSLIVVQPRAARELSLERYERLAQSLAAGQRWKVLGLMAALAGSGAGLAVGAHGDGSWWAVIALHAGLLVAALAMFVQVSWRLWPRRLFALPAELPGVQARFRLVASVLLVLVGSACVTGTIAQVVRTGS
jgi:hypothetical protein